MTTPTPSPEPAKPADASGRSRISTGLAISLLFHGVLLAALIAVPYHYYYGADKDSSGSGDLASAPPAPAPKGVSSPAEITGPKVETKLTEVLTQVDKLSTEEKLDKLEGTAKQLDKVTSEKGVEELSGLFEGWLKTEKRATTPAQAAPTGPFDFNTAQFHDVTRDKGTGGRWQYHSVLIDSAGRTMEVDLDANEGETAYRTFQILKANPLAEKIYRQVTMPILDKLTRAAREANRLAEEAERAKRAEELPAVPAN